VGFRNVETKAMTKIDMPRITGEGSTRTVNNIAKCCLQERVIVCLMLRNPCGYGASGTFGSLVDHHAGQGCEIQDSQLISQDNRIMYAESRKCKRCSARVKCLSVKNVDTINRNNKEERA
jgi:hypothetical protein